MFQKPRARYDRSGRRSSSSAADVAHLDLGPGRGLGRAELRVAVGASAPDAGDRRVELGTGGAAPDEAPLLCAERGGRGTVPRTRRAMGTMLDSLAPRLTTMFTFTGARPAAAAASIPSSTRATGKSTSFMARKTSSSSESRLTLTRL